MTAALLDQFGTTVKPGKLGILDIDDDTFCAAHGTQQLAFWNAHYDERGFASTFRRNRRNAACNFFESVCLSIIPRDSPFDDSIIKFKSPRRPPKSASLPHPAAIH
jgi:hypothetical protein